MQDFAHGAWGATSPSRLARMCDAVIRWTLVALAFLVPLFFLPWTSNVLELHKQLLVIVGAGVAGLAWVAKMLAERKFEYRQSVVNAMVLLFFGVYVASTLMSQSRYSSLMGDFGQEKSGLFTVFAFVIIYFVTATAVKDLKDLRRLLNTMVAGGFVAGLFALLQALGLFLLPFDFTKASSFNTIGSVGTLAVYMSFVVALCGGLLLIGHRQTEAQRKRDMVGKIFMAVTAAIALFIVALVDFNPIWWSLLAASAVLIVFAFFHAGQMKGIRGVLLPMIALLVSLFLMYFRFPLSAYQAEVMPSLAASKDVAMKTLREHAMLGSGPGTFLFDYAKHRSPGISQSIFWNVRFDRSASRFWTMAATTGLLGAISWLMASLFLLLAAGRRLLKTDEETWHVIVGIFSAWTLLLVSRFLYSSSMALEFLFWFMMALLVAVLGKNVYTVKLDDSPRASMTLSFVFILGIAIGLSSLFVQGQRVAAEVAYAQAIAADRQADRSADDVLKLLEKAAALNPENDVYRRNLGIAYLKAADLEASTPVKIEDAKDKKDKEAKTAAAQEEKNKKVTVLAAAAVNSAKLAADINPVNVTNWSTLGMVYQAVMSKEPPAADWAALAYGKAIELEPSNPASHSDLGKVYIFQADVVAQEKAATKDEKLKAAADAQMNGLLDKALDSLNKAVELKSDYAPAHYQISLVLDRQGKLKEAIRKMESVLSLNPQDVGVGVQLSLLYFRDERKDDAVKLLEAIVKFAPTYADAHWLLSAMYEQKNDLDKAIVEAEKVVQLNPDNEAAKKRLEELKAKKAGASAPESGELPPPPGAQPTNPKEPGVKR